jgi:hypothetical protein
MTDFKFTPLVNSPHADVVSAALGATAANLFGSVDIGQIVKMGSGQNYVQAVTTNEIEGVVVAVDGITVNDGFSFGSVQKDKRVRARVAADQSGAITLLGLVVAGTPIALGTANGYPQVKDGTPTVHKWRVIRIISGTGVAGDDVLIERI